MALQPDGNHESWSSRLVFLLAAVGAAVGLGNIWKFPYIAGANGGGAFVVVYLGCVVIVAIPILMAEVMIGRRGRRSPPNSMRRVAVEGGSRPAWGLVGWLGLLAGFLIVTFYSVIAGWALYYVFDVGAGHYRGLDSTAVAARFDELLASPGTMAVWHGIFMALTAGIVARGVQRGIERAVKIMMPALFAMLLVMIGYSAVEGDMAGGLAFLFEPDFGKIDANVVLMAIGQAFFSIGVAMGLMMTYGAYLPREVSLPQSCVVVAAADTLVAILAGIAIFPLVFANGLDPGEGPGLIFVTLPIAFGSMPGGTVFGTLFFILLTFAAVTSSIALIEPVVCWAEEHRKVRRSVSAAIAGAVAWVIGLASVFSFNVWKDVRLLGAFDAFRDKTLFDLIDYLTANVMMPVGGLVMAVFAGWWMSRATTAEELGLAPASTAFRLWRVSIRFVAPLAIFAILVSNLA